MNRYHVYKWLVRDYILIDTKTKEIQTIVSNLDGMIIQRYLDDPEKVKISGQKIAGLIKRTHKPMNMYNSRVIDNYIYHLIMTNEQKEKCGEFSSYLKLNNDEFITSGDNYEEVIENMRAIVRNKEVA